MADRGHILTETILADIEDRCKEEYEIAAREMRKKYRDYMAAFEEGRKQQYALWQAGKISKEEYTNWVYRHTMIGKRWEKMADTLAADMQRTNEMALAIAQGRMPDVFALNGNYATYQIEHDGKIDTGFTLYNHDTAAYLMEDRQLMPGPSSAKAAEIAADKTMQWNKRKIQSAVLQGVLQGESPYQIADRLRGVAEMNYHASVRYARTMTTSAQNAGRYESFHRADKLGVDLTLEWQATLDGRTRHSHRLLHGMRTTVDKPFVVDGVKIMYPAQSSGAGASDIPQALIWNCRCTILAWVKGFEGDTVKSSPKMGKMSFEEWQHAKEPKKKVEKTAEETTPKMTQEEREKILNESFVMKQLNASGIKKLDVSKYSRIPTEEEIIKKMRGGDKTDGSCVSLCLAYAANKQGYDVTDFRGGKSQDYLSWLGTSIVNKHGIVDTGRIEIDVAMSLLPKIEQGKEYIFIAGKHAAIVRNHEGTLQYLELQDEDGEWYTLGKGSLLNRFGCRKSRSNNSWTGKARLFECSLTDIDNLKGDPVFEEVLPFINTTETKQKKGVGGYAK